MTPAGARPCTGVSPRSSIVFRIDRILPPTRGRSKGELATCSLAGEIAADPGGEAVGVIPGEPDGEDVGVGDGVGEVVGTVRRGSNSCAFDLGLPRFSSRSSIFSSGFPGESPGDGVRRGSITAAGVDLLLGVAVGSAVSD